MTTSTRKTASVMGGALAGGASGATIGTAVLPGWGTAIGGGVGAIAGGLGGYLSSEADSEDQQNDPDYQARMRREKSMALMSQALGRAFARIRPTTMQGAMKSGV